MEHEMDVTMGFVELAAVAATLHRARVVGAHSPVGAVVKISITRAIGAWLEVATQAKLGCL